ncbi:unnamed protein product [Closterium sp. NIES-53]
MFLSRPSLIFPIPHSSLAPSQWFYAPLTLPPVPACFPLQALADEYDTLERQLPDRHDLCHTTHLCHLPPPPSTPPPPPSTSPHLSPPPLGLRRCIRHAREAAARHDMTSAILPTTRARTCSVHPSPCSLFSPHQAFADAYDMLERQLPDMTSAIAHGSPPCGTQLLAKILPSIAPPVTK